MKVGQLARRTGKSVRALRLYEELGLLRPAARSEGGFRLYGSDAVVRVYWIAKLQDLGFTLAQIGELLRTVEEARRAPEAMESVRELFRARLEHTRSQVARLLELRSLPGQAPETQAAPEVCATCDTTAGGRHTRPAPPLVAGLVRKAPAAHARADGGTA